MKQYLRIFHNWRINALFALSALALLLIIGESDDLTALAVTKILGFGLGFIAYRLAALWDAQGKLQELDVFQTDNL